ncbi:MAG TPA: MTAP family purine nucleoside phosphorylase [Candidatus Dormibacteraeota bacterium]|nr:MTAP family purine nucleoside phosphorylase [Candidatus Dormibacteraeota bacterium]
MSAKIAIVGGTDVQRLAEVLRVRPVEVETPFGEAQVHLGEGELGDLAVVLRHGPDHGLPSHRVNYRANLKALSLLGVTRVVATYSVSSLDEELEPGGVMVPDQFIDLTGTASTFLDAEPNGAVAADVSEPFCSGLAELLAARAEAGGLTVRNRGTCICRNGARNETKAEVRMLRQFGGDVVGHSACPETALARELGLHYAGLAVAAEWAAGVGGDRRVDRQQLARVRSRLLPPILDALREEDLPACRCRERIAAP